MKKIIFICLTLVLVTLNNCGGGGDSSGNDGSTSGDSGEEKTPGKPATTFDESLRGEWIYVDSGERKKEKKRRVIAEALYLGPVNLKLSVKMDSVVIVKLFMWRFFKN